MTETQVDATPGRRTGALWVAATGAFLILAAATVFVATRWDDIPEGAKLAVLVGLTGAAVLIGDRVRAKLPATGTALFHLGALLIPVDGAALALRIGLDWPELLFATGLLSVGALSLLASRSHSAVLAAAAAAGVVATTAGLGAMTGVPAPLVLAIAAVGGCWFTVTERHAWAWACVAGLAPVVAFALNDIVSSREVAEEIGVLAGTPWYLSIAAGLISAGVIARAAQRRNEPALAIIGLAALVAHGIAAWSAATVPTVVEVLAIPSLFLLVEVGALLAKRDAFWREPGNVVGLIAEVMAIVPTAVAAVTGILFIALDGEPDGLTAIACAITGLAWVVAGIRHERWELAPLAAIWGLTAVGVATSDALIVAVSAFGFAVVATALVKQYAIPLVAGLVSYAAVVGATDPDIAFAVGVASTLVLAVALVFAKATDEERALGVVVGSLTLALGVVVGSEVVGHIPAAIAWVACCWLLAVTADLRGEGSGDAARILAFAGLIPMLGWPTGDLLIPALLLTVLAAGEAVPRGRVVLAQAAVFPLVLAQFALADLAGLGVGVAGLALCVAAAVWLGLSMLTPAPWHQPLQLAALVSGAFGVLAATAQPDTLGPALIILGFLAIGQGLLFAKAEIAHIGGVVATLGIWLTLATNQVLAAEAYALPVALQLLVAGIVSRQNGRTTNSWVAYGPAIGLLAAAGMAERLDGGDAWHAVFAGTVGVIAVVVGGSRRLAAPLLLGTATLVAIVAHESFDTAAGIPTWAWLATGGATLIGSAVLMERNDLGPIEAGRRVVDVVAAHFE